MSPRRNRSPETDRAYAGASRHGRGPRHARPTERSQEIWGFVPEAQSACLDEEVSVHSRRRPHDYLQTSEPEPREVIQADLEKLIESRRHLLEQSDEGQA